MKKILPIITCCLSHSFLFGQTGSIVVTVKGADSNQGKIEIGLFKSAQDFPMQSKAFKGTSISASKTGATYQFTGIPAGTYAIAVFHDRNGNKKIDKNIVGMPVEEYGFSNNVYGTFGPPDFQEVSFKLAAGKNREVTISID